MVEVVAVGVDAAAVVAVEVVALVAPLVRSLRYDFWISGRTESGRGEKPGGNLQHSNVRCGFLKDQ